MVLLLLIIVVFHSVCCIADSIYVASTAFIATSSVVSSPLWTAWKAALAVFLILSAMFLPFC